MKDRPISVTAVCATLLWIFGYALGIIYCVTGIQGTGVMAMLIAAAGATLTVRGYLVRLADTLLERERNAFLLGRDKNGPHAVD
jgi:hypothetical protein